MTAPRWPHPDPMPHRWGPPHEPPRRDRSGLVVFLALLFVLGGVLFAAAALGRSTLDGAAPEPPVFPTESATPELPLPEDSAEPTVAASDRPGLPPREWPALPAPNATNPDWVTLQRNALYPVQVPPLTSCPTPATVRTLRELEAGALAQMDCIQAAWRPVLARLGFRTTEVPVYFYRGDRVDTPCGEVSAPALYCSAQGGAIYFGEATLNGASWHEFGVKDMAGHEYGHHLQAEAGMFVAEYNVGGTYESARRMELQATCVSYAMLARDDSFEMTEEVYASFEPYLRSVVEDGIHGSRDSVAYWGLRGLYSDTLGNCNTWTVPAEDVD